MITEEMKTLRGRRDWGQMVRKRGSDDFWVTFVLPFFSAQPPSHPPDGSYYHHPTLGPL